MNRHTQSAAAQRRTSLTCTALAVSVLLSACGAPVLTQKADAKYEADQRRAQVVHSVPPLADQAGPTVVGGGISADNAAARQSSVNVARRASTPFIGSKMVPVTQNDGLPSIFQEPFNFEFKDVDRSGGDGGVSLSVAMARVTKMTGVAIRIQPDVYASEGRSGSAAPAAGGATPGAPMPMPSPVLTNAAGAGAPGGGAPMVKTAAGQPSPLGQGDGVAREGSSDAVFSAQPLTLRSVEMQYRGTMTGFLDRVTDRLGLAWEYRDNTIVISRFVIEIHEVKTSAGSVKYSLGSGGSSSGTSGAAGGGSQDTSNSTAQVTETGQSDVITSMEKTITAMIAEVPGSSVTRSDGSGRLIVKTSREMQSRVRDYIKAENVSMSRQALIQFDVYSVSSTESDQHGVDWNAALSSLRFPALSLTAASPATLVDATVGSATVSVLGGQGGTLSKVFGNSNLIVQALRESGYTVQHRPVSFVAPNRQWARTSKLGTEYYLSETTPGPASSTGVGAPGLKTDKITTGDRYAALPQILDDNTILLKFDMSLSDLLGLFDVSVGTGLTAQKVQAPKTSAVSVQMPVMLKPGQIVAITGLSRDVASKDHRTLGEGIPLAAGGSQTLNTTREYFLIFVRATEL